MGRITSDIEKIDRYNGTKLTGLLGWLYNAPLNGVCVITAAGPSLNEFNPVRFCRAACGGVTTIALAGGLAVWHRAGIRPDAWIVTDTPIVKEYAHAVMPHITILAGRQAAEELTKRPYTVPHTLYTFNTEGGKPRIFNDGYRVWSRGTCAIAAMMVMWLIGVRCQYVLGMDCARTDDLYHYDNRKHPVRTEQFPTKKNYFPDGCLTTPHIDRMRQRLREADEAGLFSHLQITIVGHSHQPVERFRRISYDEFYQEIEKIGDQECRDQEDTSSERLRNYSAGFDAMAD